MQESEVRSQNTGVRIQESEYRSQKSESEFSSHNKGHPKECPLNTIYPDAAERLPSSQDEGTSRFRSDSARRLAVALFGSYLSASS